MMHWLFLNYTLVFDVFINRCDIRMFFACLKCRSFSRATVGKSNTSIAESVQSPASRDNRALGEALRFPSKYFPKGQRTDTSF